MEYNGTNTFSNFDTSKLHFFCPWRMSGIHVCVYVYVCMNVCMCASLCITGNDTIKLSHFTDTHTLEEFHTVVLDYNPF